MMGQLMEGWCPALGLATATPAKQAALFEGLVWMGLFVAACVLAAAGLMMFKRRLLRSSEPDMRTLTLGPLRRLRDNGMLTVEEYDRLRDRALQGYLRSGRAGGGSPGPSARHRLFDREKVG